MPERMSHQPLRLPPEPGLLLCRRPDRQAPQLNALVASSAMVAPVEGGDGPCRSAARKRPRTLVADHDARDGGVLVSRPSDRSSANQASIGRRCRSARIGYAPADSRERVSCAESANVHPGHSRHGIDPLAFLPLGGARLGDARGTGYARWSTRSPTHVQGFRRYGSARPPTSALVASSTTEARWMLHFQRCSRRHPQSACSLRCGECGARTCWSTFKTPAHEPREEADRQFRGSMGSR